MYIRDLLRESLATERISLGEGAWLRLLPGFVPEHESLMQNLLSELQLRQEEVRVFGRLHLTPRLTAWYADPGLDYRYSGRRFPPTPWTRRLGALREKVCAALDSPFNAVLVNYYRDGADSMGAHADDEAEIGPTPHDRRIASLSLGQRRIFRLKPRHPTPAEPKRHDFALGEGDLLLMAGTTQSHYLHELPKTRRAVGPRLNLTFRCVHMLA